MFDIHVFHDHDSWGFPISDPTTNPAGPVCIVAVEKRCGQSLAAILSYLTYNQDAPGKVRKGSKRDVTRTQATTMTGTCGSTCNDMIGCTQLVSFENKWICCMQCPCPFNPLPIFNGWLAQPSTGKWSTLTQQILCPCCPGSEDATLW